VLDLRERPLAEFTVEVKKLDDCNITIYAAGN
jgi:hypothetical protein